MTKYILHGGETGIPNGHNKAFYQEWVKDFKPDFIPSILLVYFARPKKEWPLLERSDKERFAKHTNNRSVNFIIASLDKMEFLEQIRGADVIYFRGGSTDVLMSVVEPIKDKLIKAWNGKVCIGSSAGVMFLSHYTRSDLTPWRKGLALLPFNSFVHYSDKLKDDLKLFKDSHPDNEFEYILLPETEFVVRKY